MAKITREVAKIFGSNAGIDEIAVFGSLAASSPAFSTDPSTIQGLGNWLGGWFSGVEAGNSPAIEDMNAFCYVMAYQVAYLMQTGVAEWNAETTYYIGSIASNSTGSLYVSIADTNLNNALTDTSKWRSIVGSAAPQVSTSCGTFSTASGSLVDITNLSVSITTSGRPVLITLISDGTSVGAGSNESAAAVAQSATGDRSIKADLAFLRGATILCNLEFGLDASSVSGGVVSIVPVSTFQHIDIVAAGTYTYKAQMALIAGSSTAIQFAKLIAIEL